MKCPVCNCDLKNPNLSTWSGIETKTKTFVCISCHTKVIVLVSYLKLKAIACEVE